MSDLPDASLAWLAEHHGVITAALCAARGRADRPSTVSSAPG